MKSVLSSFVVGLIFALGLGIAGMTQPEKVVGFLDIFGAWDPSLAFVMIGAISVHGILYPIITKRKSPLFSREWHIPQRSDLTPSLWIGASLFGIGWGMVGYCPAPALTALPSLRSEPLIFVLSMICGMLLFRLMKNHLPWKSRAS